MKTGGKSKASRELFETIFSKIRSGEWGPGYKLPSEPALAEEHGVSRATVREALQELISCGCIRREQGKGTYVLHPTIDYGMDELMSITHLLEKYGFTPSTNDVEITIGSAGSEDAQSLNISVLEPVYTIHRVRCADGIPVVYDSVVIPYKFLPLPDKKKLEGSLFALLDEVGIHVMQGAGKVSVITASDQMAEKLSLDKQKPLLCMYNVLYDQNGTAIMVTRDYYTDRVQFPLRRTRKDFV